jgi:YVTN family beta-propeller protein
MNYRPTLRRSSLALTTCLSLFGCSGSEEPDLHGEAELALLQVPADVACIRITAAGARTVERNLDVVPGANTVFNLTALPTGNVSFSGQAFSQACSSVGSNAPNWVGDPVSAVVTTSPPVQVTLSLRRNGRSTVGVDFEDDPVCALEGSACTTNAGCCTGLACTGGVCVDSAPARDVLFALITSDLSSIPIGPPPTTALEVVDLSAGTRLRTVALGQRSVASLAVLPGGARAYVSDATNNQIVLVDTSTGAETALIPLQGPRDLLLSADGSTLYAGSSASVVAITTATNTIQSSLPIGGDTPLGLALSPDGSRLAVPVSQGGSNVALRLLTTGPLLVPGPRIPLTGNVPGCATQVGDSVFASAGRVLVWDSNCDALYQVDVASGTQLAGQTIATGRDSGSSFNYNNALLYSASAARAYVFNESQRVLTFDPIAATFVPSGGFAASVVADALTPAGNAVYFAVARRFNGGLPDQLDRLDTATGTIARGVYTFSDPGKTARDLRILSLAP